MIGFDPGAWEPETWTAVAAWMTVGIYVGLLVFAWRQVRQARQLQQEETRPWVVVYFEIDWLTGITIENIGKTVAHDVRIAFEPPLASTLSKPWSWEESTLLRQGIDTLPPHQKVTLLFDTAIDRYQDTNLPRSYKATVTYTGLRKKPHSDSYVLDLDLYLGTQGPPDGLPAIAEYLEQIMVEVKKWTDSYLGGGLRVQVSDRERIERRDLRKVIVRRAHRLRRQDGVVAMLTDLGRRWLRRRTWWVR